MKKRPSSTSWCWSAAVEDVDVVARDEEVDDGGDDSLAVGTVDEQDGDLWIGHDFLTGISFFGTDSLELYRS